MWLHWNSLWSTYNTLPKDEFYRLIEKNKFTRKAWKRAWCWKVFGHTGSAKVTRLVTCLLHLSGWETGLPFLTFQVPLVHVCEHKDFCTPYSCRITKSFMRIRIFASYKSAISRSFYYMDLINGVCLTSYKSIYCIFLWLFLIKFFLFCLCISVSLSFPKESFDVALSGLEFTIHARLAMTSQGPSFLWLQSVVIKGVWHRVWPSRNYLQLL